MDKNNYVWHNIFLFQCHIHQLHHTNADHKCVYNEGNQITGCQVLGCHELDMDILLIKLKKRKQDKRLSARKSALFYEKNI